ncbi:hypothetical protein Acsp06_58340 [Actinomycetospora sp. NBRC 106375]|uniref:DUF6544 family protein n=1 Tax=Actinomycetospora sp. NBRC 106375 TaxID=3032207 RepID=UPI0024A2997F|nr:DUF6544 family protein [Actinomycetospora sp. NBRC 106375]GLZ49649.1 hypothetical protein Acsp06_58340 [Actinomycetospora sp. NBRC 106375]
MTTETRVEPTGTPATTRRAATGTTGNDDPGSAPEPAARYARCSVAPAAHGVIGVRMRSRGMICLGRRWWPYRGHEVTLPTHGYFRELRVAGVLRIVDSWVAGHARRETTVLGRHRHPAVVGPDLARADLAHAAMCAIWVPSVLLPSDTAHWTADGRDSATVAFAVAGAPVALHLTLHRGGLPRRATTTRWGDPRHQGVYRDEPFGAEILEHRTYGGLTVPATGILGWGIGAPGPTREVLRFQLTALTPVSGTDALPGPGCIGVDAGEGDTW